MAIKKIKFIVLDRYGFLVRGFETYQEASNFKIINQRYDWTIINKK